MGRLEDYLNNFLKFSSYFSCIYGPLHDNTTHQAVPVSKQDNSCDKTAHQLAAVYQLDKPLIAQLISLNFGELEITFVRLMPLFNFDILY